jgi:hypothetical protein
MTANPASNDTPEPFGYKTAWLAISTDSAKEVVEELALKKVASCSWKQGVRKAYGGDGLFVTPSVQGWTLVVGDLPEIGQPDLRPMLERLSSRFGTAMYFGTHRVVEYHAWARAERGVLVRAFGFLGESGEYIANVGARTPAEVELNVGLADEHRFPDEESVLKLAGKWSLDPREFGPNTRSSGAGWFGTR